MDKFNLELLSPAGSPEALRAAVNCGCDAVYLGSKSFSARGSAANFDGDELRAAIEYCHLRGVRVYLAVNTLVKERELSQAAQLAHYAYEVGADAFITQDLGFAAQLSRLMPNIELHASTQMTAHNLYDVRELVRRGFSRVVLSRELGLREIDAITKGAECELEVFAHGALCVCYSGRCLMSAIIGGRSGNRGRCAQPCRLPYALARDGESVGSGYLLSPMDMCAGDSLRGLYAASQSSGRRISLKIEGRLRAPEYVAVATSTYRRAIDRLHDSSFDGKPLITSDEMEALAGIFNRGGNFNAGYFKQFAGKSMMSGASPKHSGVLIGKVSAVDPKSGNVSIKLTKDVVPGDGIEIITRDDPHPGGFLNKAEAAGATASIRAKGNARVGDSVYKTYDKLLNDNAAQLYARDTRKLSTKAKLRAIIGEPLQLTLYHRSDAIANEGVVVEKAAARPLSAERLVQQICKTGETPFCFELECEIDDDIFVNIGEVNELRRRAVDALTAHIFNLSRRTANIEFPTTQSVEIEAVQPIITAMLSDNSQVSLMCGGNIKRVYLPTYDQAAVESLRQNGVEAYLTLPSIDRDIFAERLIEQHAAKVDGFLARNIGQLSLLQSLNLHAVGDYTLNTYNSSTVAELSAYAHTIAISPELSFAEIADITCANLEILAYGRLTLMTTHQCPIGLYSGAKNSGRYCKLRHNSHGYTLNDRKGYSFPITTDCDQCAAFILNSVPTDISDKLQSVPPNIAALRLTFTTESPDEISRVIDAFADNSVKIQSGSAITYGRYFKGVE